jgi:hypothetical protein
MTDATRRDAPTGEDDDGVGRRTLVRAVLAVAFGVPVVVEGLTFAELLGGTLLGGDRSGGQATADAPGSGGGDAPEGSDAVGVGDDLLPSLPGAATLSVAVLRVGGTAREFRVDVAVENPTDATYDVRLGAVTTRDGRSVDGGVSTTVPPGEAATLSAAWGLPTGAVPETLSVSAAVGEAEATREATLGRVPRRNGAA